MSGLMKCVALVITVLLIAETKAATKQRVILVLIDGLRYDLFNTTMSSLDSMAIKGVKAEYINPVFPSLSLPSMYSIATGLYVESHGAVYNVFYDIESGHTSDPFSTAKIPAFYDTGVEPIWVTAQRNGLKTGLYQFPGGGVPVKGVSPSKNLDITLQTKNTSFNERVDDIMLWLTEDDLDLVFLHYIPLDFALHYAGGIGSPAMSAKIREVDEGIDYLFEKLKENKLLNTTNVIVTADHGHLEVAEQLKLFDYIDADDVELVPSSTYPFVPILPKDGKEETIYESLKNAHPNITVYKKEEFPNDLHYANNVKVLPILVMADPPYVIITGNQSTLFTQHGYPNTVPEMRSIFYAQGPSFKSGHIAQPFNEVSIYPLLCELLGLEPLPNNGSLSVVSDLVQYVKYVTSGQRLVAVETTSFLLMLASALQLAHQ
ncbi:ectonucleotide pyrophosphatase/phosphodiesterase family member 7-like [Glandiceps talaboti]